MAQVVARPRKKLKTLTAELGGRDPAPAAPPPAATAGVSPEGVPPSAEQRLADNMFLARWIASFPARYLPPPLAREEEDVLAGPIAELLVRYTALDKLGPWGALAFGVEMVYGPRMNTYLARRREEAARANAAETAGGGGFGIGQDPAVPPASRS